MYLIFVLLIIYNLFVIFIKKKLSIFEIYVTTFFAIAFGRFVDSIFDVMYHLYWFVNMKPNWLALLAQLLIYPSSNTLFLNFFPYRNGVIKKMAYIFGWTLFALLIEFFSVKTGFFNYNGWNIWYSAIFYPITFVILLLNFYLTRYLLKKFH